MFGGEAIDEGGAGFRLASAAPPPWRLVVLWATGPDTTVDGLYRLQALRRAPGEGGGWERFERWCRPFAHDPFAHDAEGPLEGAAPRAAREAGLAGADLASAPPAEEAFGELAAFLAGGPILTADRRGFEAWHGCLRGERPEEPVLGLEELAALFQPGRRSSAPEAARTPEALRARLADVAGRFLGLDRTTLALAGAGFSAAHAGLAESEPALARRLDLALAFVQHPSAWDGGAGGLADGRLPLCGDGAEAADAVRLALPRLKPRHAELTADWELHGTVPVTRARDGEGEEGDGARAAEHAAALDAIFETHLPRAFARDAAASYREGQHRVARAVAQALQSNELLLVHAPTGTGKTLAYLVPALLCAAAEDVRIGVSTYTRALQEQAMDIEVPRALAALRQAGVELAPRVTLLKGRANYLCWRALLLHAPGELDGPGAWLAFTALALFARTADDGDLDRFPRASPLAQGTALERPFLSELDGLVRAVRAGQGCCSASADRETCAAETARWRAERSHVVITNHAFTLARAGFFKRVVLDECEHLHEQAHAAFSHSLSLAALREQLSRLCQGERAGSRSPLDRLERLLPLGEPAEAALERCLAARGASLRALEALSLALAAFKAWRERERPGRDAREAHGLLRAYVELADGGAGPEADGARALIAAREALQAALLELQAALAGLGAEVEELPERGMPQLRRALEQERAELEPALAALAAWIPLEDGRPRFRRETFHALETDARGRDVLAARVLLPNEYLGRWYYPELESGVLISATTWLAGGFDAARGYLGLDRAAEPAPDEQRAPSRVRTFRAPDPFDYGRVLVCIPSDAPPYKDKPAFDAYVRDFIAHLGERTRGRLLALFTNADDVRRAGSELAGFFRARRIPFWFQNMPGHDKEELGLLFRERVDSILLGVDTFWYGADFPGETLEYLVIVKLPYGVPDAYHQAQCAALGEGEQRRRIYMPRALAKLRQGFGRLLRRESDRGVVFVLDRRALEPRHAAFLRELPLAGGPLSGAEPHADGEWSSGGARLVRADAETCLRAAFAHMGLAADVERRGLDQPFGPAPTPERGAERAPPPRPEILDIPFQDVPF